MIRKEDMIFAGLILVLIIGMIGVVMAQLGQKPVDVLSKCTYGFDGSPKCPPLAITFSCSNKVCIFSEGNIKRAEVDCSSGECKIRV